ncbi:MAG: PilN domain-containing protein [bacterium]
MIKINLLPKEIEKKVALREKKFLLSTIVVLAVVGFLGLYFLKVGQYSRLRKQLRKVEKELVLLEAIVKQVDEIEKSKETLSKKLDVIRSLMGNRLIYPQLLEDLARIVPSRVWLNSLRTQTESDYLTITIGASAIDNYAIADFITRLSEAKNFSKVELGNITSREREEKEIIRNFGVTCEYR